METAAEAQKTLRILVVDDSVVVRKLATRHLGAVPNFEMLPPASRGRQALEWLAESSHHTDLVILDMEMPGLSGFDTLDAVMRRHPEIRVIMFSAGGPRAGVKNSTALRLGARFCVGKPQARDGAQSAWGVLIEHIYSLFPAARPGPVTRIAEALTPSPTPRPAASSSSIPQPLPPHIEASPQDPVLIWDVQQSRFVELSTPLPQQPTLPTPLQPTEELPISPTPVAQLRRELIAQAQTAVPLTPPPLAPTPAPQPRRKRRSARLAPAVIIIGASTGGPNALREVLGHFSHTPKVPILIVQHMPASYTQQLAKDLTRHTRLTVREAVNGEVLSVGEVLVAPGGFHLRLKRKGGQTVVQLDQGPLVNFVRPAVDCTLESAHAVFGGAVGVAILTGMGHDGLAGCRLLADAGATILVQDEESSTIWGMPGAVSRAGLARAVLKPAEIGTRLSGMDTLSIR